MLCPFWGELGLREHNVVWAEVYLRNKCHIDPSSRLAITDMGQNLEAVLLLREGLGPHLTQCGRAEAYSMPRFILIRPTV